MKKKRLLAFALAGMMAVSLGACGGAEQGGGEGSSQSKSEKKEASEPSGGENSGKTELANDKYVNVDPAFMTELSQAVEEGTGIQLEVSSYPDTASYQTYIQQSIRGEEAPGLFTWWSGPQFETLAKEGVLEDLTQLWEDYLIPAGVSKEAAEELTVDGKVYGAVNSIVYTSIQYSVSAFEEAGVEVPETFDEFLDVCEKLKEKGITPLALKSDSWAGFLWFQQLLCAKDPQLYKDVCDGTKKYTDPEVVEVMNLWKDMLDKGYFSKPIDTQDVNKQLASGKMAMRLEDSANLAILNRDYGMKSGEDLETFVLPLMDSNEKRVIFYEVSPLCVAKESADKDAAMEVMKKYYENGVQDCIYKWIGYANTPQVNITDAALEDLVGFTTDTENYQLILRYYENTPQEIRDVALDELMRFELGDGTVDEVLSTIQKKADEVWAAQK